MVKLKIDSLSETHPLVRFANKMCGFYGHPVFLVGSQLDSETPRDVDIVCEIPDDQFKSRYFSDWWNAELSVAQEVEKFFLGVHTGVHTEEHWNWYEDMLKKSLLGMKTLHIPIDFKVYPKSYSENNFQDKPKLRLDTRGY